MSSMQLSKCRKYDTNMWENIVMVKALDHKFHPYKSLILDQQGIIYTSIETSNLIMKKIFARIGMTYHQNCQIIKKMALMYNYKLPYIFGGKIFLQEQGNAKQSTTWYAIHHLINYELYTKRDVMLEFKNVKVKTYFSKESFQNQLVKIKRISYIHKKCLEYIDQKLNGNSNEVNYIHHEIDKIDLKIDEKNIENVIREIVKKDEQ